MDLYTIRPFLAVLVSLLAVPLIIVTRPPNLREGWSILAGILKFGLIASMLPDIIAGHSYKIVLLNLIPNVDLSLRVDPLGLTFALVASFLWIVTSFYSIGYMRGLEEHSQTRYFAFFAVAISSTIGIAFASNLLTLYIFYELLSLSTYPLVTHHQDTEAKAAGRRYLVYLLGTSIGFVLPGLIYLYSKFGTLDFRLYGFVTTDDATPGLGLACLLLVFGFAKVAIMPFHSWLPAAMVAPTPVSALLHAVAVVKAGAFSVTRTILYIFGPDFLSHSWARPVIIYTACLTILLGSAIALYQKELKRLLAFSTISQLSYIVLGVALLNPYSVKGAALQLAMHAVGKITLFFGAGAVLVATGRRLVHETEGLGKRMPFTFLAFFVGALSIIGIPPTGGFWSKWNLLLGAYKAENMVAVVTLLFSSLLTVCYLIPIVYRAFFSVKPAYERFEEAPFWTVAPMVFTALVCLFFFFVPFTHTKFLSIFSIYP